MGVEMGVSAGKRDPVRLRSSKVLIFSVYFICLSQNHQALRLDCGVFLPTGRYLTFYIKYLIQDESQLLLKGME